MKNPYDELFEQMDINKSFNEQMKELAERAANNPELMKYFNRLKEFSEKYCYCCGTQRCLGVYDKNWREGCLLYKKEFNL